MGSKGTTLTGGSIRVQRYPSQVLCTSGQILLTDSDVTQSKICPDVQRPGRGVVGLVMTHWLTWYPQIPRFMKCGIEKIKDRCECSLNKEEYPNEANVQNPVNEFVFCAKGKVKIKQISINHY